MRTMHFFLMAILLLSNAPARGQGAGAVRPIYSLEDGTPTQEKLRAFVRDGVAWGTPEEQAVRLGADGVATPQGGGFSSLGYLVCLCEPPPKYTVASGAIEYSCTFHCRAHQTGNADQNTYPPKEISNSWKKFRYTPLYISTDTMLYVDEASERWLVDDCRSTTQFGQVARKCRSRNIGAGWFLTELISGAQDPAIFEAIREWLQRDVSSPSAHRTILVQGPRARTPRATTEIYYAVNKGVSEQEAIERAQTVATALARITGNIPVRKWPGPWMYDVVVVAGASKAQ